MKQDEEIFTTMITIKTKFTVFSDILQQAKKPHPFHLSTKSNTNTKIYMEVLKKLDNIFLPFLYIVRASNASILYVYHGRPY